MSKVTLTLKKGTVEIEATDVISIMGGYGCPCATVIMRDKTSYKTRYRNGALRKILLGHGWG